TNSALSSLDARLAGQSSSHCLALGSNSPDFAAVWLRRGAEECVIIRSAVPLSARHFRLRERIGLGVSPRSRHRQNDASSARSARDLLAPLFRAGAIGAAIFSTRAI